jgi:hypothetical protein
LGTDSFEKTPQTAGVGKSLQANDLLEGAIALKDLGFVQPMDAGNQGIDDSQN